MPGLVMALLSACGGSERVEDVLELAGDSVAGETHFQQTCGNSSCHGANGIDGDAPDFPSAVPHHSDEGLVEVMINGVGSMPAQDSLSDQQMADILEFLRDTFGDYEGGGDHSH